MRYYATLSLIVLRELDNSDYQDIQQDDSSSQETEDIFSNNLQIQNKSMSNSDKEKLIGNKLLVYGYLYKMIG